MKIWITGIAGFLGSHLAEALITEGHEVSGNDNLICGNEDNLVSSGMAHFIQALGEPHIVFNRHRVDRELDCTDFDEMQFALSRFEPDVLIHCAATAHEGLSSFSPSFITSNIYEASVATFSAAIAAGVKRIVFMSSMARYGNGIYQDLMCKNLGQEKVYKGDTYDLYGLPFLEWHAPAPVDPYGIAKVAAEDTLKVLCKTHDVKWTIAVPHNIIGIRQRSVDPYRNVAAIMINRCKQGKPPIIYGDGNQKRCFSPVKDVIPSLLKMAAGAADGEIVNIGPDKGEITVKELAQKIIKFTGFQAAPIYMPDRPNEVKEAYCSSDKARRLLGYKEQQNIDDCLKEMVDYIQPAPFVYDFPLEIMSDKIPKTWSERMM